jgi:hypothetical protein
MNLKQIEALCTENQVLSTDYDRLAKAYEVCQMIADLRGKHGALVSWRKDASWRLEHADEAAKKALTAKYSDLETRFNALNLEAYQTGLRNVALFSDLSDARFTIDALRAKNDQYNSDLDAAMATIAGLRTSNGRCHAVNEELAKWIFELSTSNLELGAENSALEYDLLESYGFLHTAIELAEYEVQFEPETTHSDQP